MRGVVIAILLLASTAIASAQPETTATAPAPARRTRAVSVGLWSVQGFAGLQGQHETQYRPRWSWIAGGGFRFNARGDYRSTTLAGGGELRYWLRGRALWARTARRSMIGWYVGGRADMAWTRTVDHVEDRAIGDNLAIAFTGTLGYRFLIRNRVSITPMVGLGFTQEVDLRGRLPTYTRPMGRGGLSVGYLF
jgi:hypothetical protein